MVENSISRSSWFTEGIVLAIVPAIGYYVAYKYEAAYLGHFGVPEIFASVGVEEFFAALATIVGGLWSMLLVINSVMMAWPADRRENFRLFLPLFAMIILAAIPLVFWTGLTVLLITTGIVGVFVVLFYILPLLGRKGRSYIESLRGSFESERPVISRDAFSTIEGLIGRWNVMAIVASLVLIPALAGIAGSHAAVVQKDFLSTTIEGTEYALLRERSGIGIFVAASDMKIGLKKRTYIVRELSMGEAGKLKTYSIAN